MKKYIAIVLSALALGIANQASAAAVVIAPLDIPAAAAVNNAGCTMVGAGSPFTFTPSRNVGVAYNCDTAGTVVAVNTGNTKGKYTYGGSSNGGSVTQCGGATPVAVSITTGYTIIAPAVTTTSNGCS